MQNRPPPAQGPTEPDPASGWAAPTPRYRPLGGPALGIEPLPYATGWAVGAWLVPLLNLVRPKQIMDTIWRGSDPDRPPFDPFWHRGPVPVLLHLWWAVFLASWLVDRVVVVLLRHGSSTVEGLRTVGIATLASDSLGLVLGLLCFELVRRAMRRQRARAARLAVALPAQSTA